MQTIGLVCLVLCAQTAVPQNVGWKGYLTENPTEFHDLPLSWEQDTPVPSWLSGTYVRNGPSQVTLSIFTSCLQSLVPKICKFGFEYEYGDYFQCHQNICNRVRPQMMDQ